MSHLRFGYNSNGFAHHEFEDAVSIIADLGYRAIALTLDYNVINPFDPKQTTPGRLRRWRKTFETIGFDGVVETGARFLMNPRRKHQPTLVSPEFECLPRMDFIERSIQIAATLGWTTITSGDRLN